MTRHHARIVDSWATTIRRAIELGEADAARRLAIALVRRIRELTAAIV